MAEFAAETAVVPAENGVAKRARPSDDGDSKESNEDTTKRQRETRPAPVGKEAAPIATLDDLFRKTAAKPALYWLPVSDGEVQTRKEALAKARVKTA